MKTAFPYLILFAISGSQLGFAQQTRPPEARLGSPQVVLVAAQPTATPQSSATVSATPAPITLSLPNSIKIVSSSEGDSGSSWNGWLTFCGVVLTAMVSVWLGFQTANSAKRLRELTQAEQAEKKRQADREQWLREIVESNKISIDDQQIAIELQRLGFQSNVSDRDAYLAVTRFVHERQVAEVELLHSFADKLLSATEHDRLFALFVLSAYVSPEVIARLASAGDDIIPTPNLKKLATLEGYEIAEVAKLALVRRKRTSARGRANA